MAACPKCGKARIRNQPYRRCTRCGPVKPETSKCRKT